MTAYVVSEVRVLDAELFAAYRLEAGASIERHGGRIVVRAERPRAAEGVWTEGLTLTITEFPDAAALQRWYESDEYARALVHRRRGAIERRMLFATGAG